MLRRAGGGPSCRTSTTWCSPASPIRRNYLRWRATAPWERSTARPARWIALPINIIHSDKYYGQQIDFTDNNRQQPTTTDNKENTMSFIAWIVLGLIAGFIASKLVNKTGEGMLMDIVLGIVGAVVGGWLFRTFGMPGVTGLNLYSLLVAVAGAAVFLVIYHALSRRSS